MSWLFVDPVCPKPYSLKSLESGGIGGTEATVVRVAEALGATVMQHNRNLGAHIYRARYIAPDWSQVDRVTGIVVLRCPRTALAMRQMHKAVSIHLWCHDLADKTLGTLLPELKAKGIELIAVSNFHRHNIIDAGRTYSPCQELPKIRVIYNPIEDDLKPDATPVNPNKLTFFSSPHKGLSNTLDIFSSMRNFAPELELFIANPGYLPSTPETRPGVTVLGALPRAEALQHVRESFCVLHLNHVFPETFGLVMAEANAVGTPVMTHALGAAREVMDNAVQFVDTRDRKRVIDTLMHWRLPGNRPVVEANEAFRLDRVIRQWRVLE
jgi:glycosyltransferase involved in cell wall biosynthesis